MLESVSVIQKSAWLRLRTIPFRMSAIELEAIHVFAEPRTKNSFTRALRPGMDGQKSGTEQIRRPASQLFPADLRRPAHRAVRRPAEGDVVE